MKKILLISFLAVSITTNLKAQCSFETLFPLKWGAGKHAINEYYNASPIYQIGYDTIRGSAFEHGQNYLFTARNMNLAFYSYTNKMPHPCFQFGDVVLNLVANDSGVVAYNYQVSFPASKHTEFLAIVDSLKAMMSKKFTYNHTVKNTTKASSPDGSTLTGDGVCVYYNDEPVLTSNLTYPQFVIRAGYLAKKPEQSKTVIMNQAEEIQYYRIELLYKRPMGK